MTTEPGESTDRCCQTHTWRFFPAILVIGLGILFLLNNLGYQFEFMGMDNWWAWLIVLAALAPAGRAVSLYRSRGRIDSESGTAMLTAVGMLLVAVFFIAHIDWGMWWPLFVILGGFYTLVRPARRQKNRSASADDDSNVKR